MDENAEHMSREEKTLSEELDRCSFIYGSGFAKIAERPRAVAAEDFSAKNTADDIGGKTDDNAAETENKETETVRAAQENGGRTRVHIDLGGSAGGKLTPSPSDGDKKLSADKKPKKR